MRNEFSYVWEVCPVGLARVSRDGRFLSVNPRLCQITGYSETELLARTFQHITHPDDMGPDNTEAAALAEDPENICYQMVKRYIRKDGNSVLVNLYVYSIRGEDGTFSYFFAFIAELVPVLHASNPATDSARKSASAKSALLKYVRDHPREALLIAAGIIALWQGKSLAELVTILAPK